MSDYKLSHLQELEAESIHIIREVAAEFENPVMLYSIGKDSSVMVRLAEKAFSPGKVPFPLMHIDSKWKFKEMIQFRDDYAKKFGWNLIVESNMVFMIRYGKCVEATHNEKCSPLAGK